MMQHPIWPVTSLATLLALLLPVVCPGPAARAQASLSFNKLLVDPAGPVDPWGKAAGDLNNDGAIDLIVGGYKSGGLIWYENPAWTPHLISGLAGFRTDHETGDIDHDGRLDVVSLGTDREGKPWLGWFRNPWPAANWVASTIDNNTLHDIEIADLDDDGRIDVVGRNQEAFPPGEGDILFIYTQTAPNTWSKFRIPCANGEGLRLADVNRDARPDIIINGFWFENTGVGTAWITHRYTSTYTYRSVAIDIADIDADSFADIVLSPSEPIGGIYRISWFKAPPDPTREGWEENIIEDRVETVHHSIGAADFDNDGTMDIATAKMHSGSTTPEVKIFLNGGEGRDWTKRVIATTGSHNMRIIDVDNNGSKDLFGANWRGVQSEVWLNQPDTRLPAKPELVSPADGQSGVPIAANFVWKSVAAAEQYQLQVFMDSSLTQPTIDSTTTDTMATMRGLAPGGMYWWRVRAHNREGWGPYSASWTFTISNDSSVFTSTNLVVNGGFEGGKSAWRYYQNGDGNAFAVVTTAPVPEGTHQAMITLGSTIGTNNQIYQTGLMLEANTAYRITFAHHASAETRFRVRVIEQDDDYREYGFGWKYVYPTTSVQTYTLDFTTANFTGSVRDAMVQFYFVRGMPSSTIYLDDISIVKAAEGPGKEAVQATVPLDVPGEFTLMQNYPNPFNPSTTIRYGVPEKSTVRLEVFNTLGQVVATLVRAEQEAGYHEVQLDASGLAGGLYLYRLQAGDFVQTRKLLLLK
jgi:hypothetical protein